MSEIRIMAVCPDCEYSNTVNVDPGKISQKILVTCDANEGGCDRDFVVEAKTKLDIKIFVLRDAEKYR